jgi:ATP-dependent DNA ligase
MNAGVVCEVRYLAAPDRGLRHTAFVRYRVDKDWRDCTELQRQLP